MKHIKLFKKYESHVYFNYKEDKILTDIDGILIDLKDSGFRISRKINIKDNEGYINIKIEIMPTTGFNGYKKQFKYKEVKDYVHTIIDYLKYTLGDDNIDIRIFNSVIYKMYNKEEFVTNENEPNPEKEVHTIEVKIEYDDFYATS
jgi:hypothetical protein